MSEYKLKTILNRNFKPMRFRLEGKPHYQIFLEVESETDTDLEKVESVEYLLHPTFRNRTRKSFDRSNNFRIEIKAWGTFVVGLTLNMKDGSKIEFSGSMKDTMEEKYI